MCDQIPKIDGLWEYQTSLLRRNSITEKPDINNIIVISDQKVEIVQNGEFVILKLPADFVRPIEGDLFGVLTKTYISDGKNFFWTLKFADYDDNGIFTLTSSKVSSDGTILEWSGNYTESGFVGSPLQFQTIGTVKIKKITK